MVNINKIIFEFTAGNKEFAQNINRRWESFYQPVFERVAEEVMTRYEREDETCIIESLPLDLGTIPEEDFDAHFPERLKEAMHKWFRQMSTNTPETTQSGTIRRISNQQNKLEILMYFLLHGYFPRIAENENIQLGALLNEVLQSSAALFRDFLESYAHYDFLHRRLALQFTDEELESLINKCRPTESKFVNLYVRVQINAYRNKPTRDISFPDYRNAVWILVLAYLFTETGSRFNRKQLILYTLRGLAARFNFTFPGLTRMVTDHIPELEKTVEQLPELWDILKEIRQDVHAHIITADADYLDYSLREIVFSLRFDRQRHSHLFSPENLGLLLSVPVTCRKLLVQLSEKEIYRLVEIILPAESPFVIAYAQLLDKHHDRNSFAGKAGSEFSLLKWEFIFQVIYVAPLSAFNRQLFVLSVIQKLGAHYNLSTEDVLRFLLLDKEMFTIYSSLNIWPVLSELNSKYYKILPEEMTEELFTELSREDVITLLIDPVKFSHFITTYSQMEIHRLLHQLDSGQSEFIITYSQLLDLYSNKGKLEGKSGSDFQVLKWKILFSYLVAENKSFFNRKYFIYTTLSQLAAHYNQSIIDLLDYLSTEIRSGSIPGFHTDLKEILTSLYNEIYLSSATPSRIKKMDRETVSGWIVFLFGTQTSKSLREEEVMKWLVYLLENQPEVFSVLWKSGKLDTIYLLKIINSKPELQSLWIKKVGGSQLYDLWMRWMKKLDELKPITPYIINWIVQLTLRDYLGFSESEKEHFITERLIKSLPPGISAILQETNYFNIKPILEIMETNNRQNSEGIQIENAGLMLMAPFFTRLLARYLNSERKFIDDEQKIRAIFQLQYVAMGEQKEYNESQLFLNKLIVGWPTEKALPRSITLEKADIDLSEEMLTAAKNYWEKLKGSSVNTVREAFLKRAGTARLNDDRMWEITVEQKPYDMLLDSLPWTFELTRYPWNDYLIHTYWR